MTFYLDLLAHALIFPSCSFLSHLFGAFLGDYRHSDAKGLVFSFSGRNPLFERY